MMLNLDYDEASAPEAYELPPSNAYLTCFGLFIFSGVVAAFYVLVAGA
jgi:hypothetical protein